MKPNDQFRPTWSLGLNKKLFQWSRGTTFIFDSPLIRWPLSFPLLRSRPKSLHSQKINELIFFHSAFYSKPLRNTTVDVYGLSLLPLLLGNKYSIDLKKENKTKTLKSQEEVSLN